MIFFFVFFSRKQDLTFHTNCLQRRQFAWNVKTCFMGKMKKNSSIYGLLKILPCMLSVDIRYRLVLPIMAVEVSQHAHNSVTTSFRCRCDVIGTTCYYIVCLLGYSAEDVGFSLLLRRNLRDDDYRESWWLIYVCCSKCLLTLELHSFLWNICDCYRLEFYFRNNASAQHTKFGINQSIDQTFNDTRQLNLIGTAPEVGIFMLK